MWTDRGRGETAGLSAPVSATLPNALEDGLPDCLYETDGSGLPRAIRLLPDTSRAYRRRLAKEMRRWMRDLSSEYRESLDDTRVVMWFLEARLLCGATFWTGAEKPRRTGEAPMPPSLERELLERVASQHAAVLEPFTEAGMERHCSAWRRMRGYIEVAVGEPFHMMSPRRRELLMLWPIVRDALLDPALALESDRARELIEAVFALSSITFDSWFVNQVLAGRPELAGSFTRFADQLAPASGSIEDELDELDELDDEADDDDEDNSDAEDEEFLPYLPDGMVDSLYETDEHGVARALRLLPGGTRAHRRRLAKGLRRLWERLGNAATAMRERSDEAVVLSFLESRGMAPWVFWSAMAGRGAEDAPSVEAAILTRECARRAERLGPFDERAFERECGQWRSIRKELGSKMPRSFSTMTSLPRAGLDLLAVWPLLRDELADPRLPLGSERARDALEGVYALSSVTWSPYFINAVCERRSSLCAAFSELEDRFMLEDEEDEEDEEAGLDPGPIEIVDGPFAGRYDSHRALREAVQAYQGDAEGLTTLEDGIAAEVERPAATMTPGSTQRVERAEAPSEPPAAEAVGVEADAEASPDGSTAVAPLMEREVAGSADAPEETAMPRLGSAGTAAAEETAPQPTPAEAPGPAAHEAVRTGTRPAPVARGPEVAPVVQVVCELAGDDAVTALQRAREEVLAWLVEKGVRHLPANAGDGASFEIDASEGLPVTVEASDDVWALRFDTPDSAVAGRLWRTEVIMGTLKSRALVGVRLTVISPRAGVPVRWSVPRVVRRLVARPGLRDYGARLMDCPWRVETEEDVDALVGLLEQPARSRRVFALSEDRSGNTALDGGSLAKRLAGLAHVVTLSHDAAALLTARVGDGLGVFGRAMRTYAPGFTCGTGASPAHPLATRGWLEDRFESPDEFIDLLERRAIEDSVRGDLEATLPGFSRVRHWANARRLEAARREVATDTDLLALYDESNRTMMNELRDRDATIERLRLERLEVEDERDEALRDRRELRGRIEYLEQALKNRGIEETLEYPSNYEQLEGWVAQHFADRLTLLPRAVRSLKKAVFENLPLVCDCLKLLAGPYREMKRGEVSRAAFDEACRALGVTLTQSGEFSASRYASEYTVQYGKQRRVLDLHLKRGTSRDAAKCLRVYWFYDEERERVVIGHLPGHLTTSFT